MVVSSSRHVKFVIAGVLFRTRRFLFSLASQFPTSCAPAILREGPTQSLLRTLMTKQEQRDAAFIAAMVHGGAKKGERSANGREISQAGHASPNP